VHLLPEKLLCISDTHRIATAPAKPSSLHCSALSRYAVARILTDCMFDLVLQEPCWIRVGVAWMLWPLCSHKPQYAL
jgi:hypothetical protein